MNNSTLPPLFDNMDNVDISSSNEESDIFQSAIQVRQISFVFLIISFFFGCLQFSAHYWVNFPITHTFSSVLAKLLSSYLRCSTTPHWDFIFMLVLNWISLFFMWQDVEPVSPTAKEGTMEDVITATERESGDNFIEITVEEPQKVGEGMHSYLAYKWVVRCANSIRTINNRYEFHLPGSRQRPTSQSLNDDNQQCWGVSVISSDFMNNSRKNICEVVSSSRQRQVKMSSVQRKLKCNSQLTMLMEMTRHGLKIVGRAWNVIWIEPQLIQHSVSI